MRTFLAAASSLTLALSFLTAPLQAQPAGFPDLAGIVAEMTAAANNHPNICQLVNLTAKYSVPKTHQGRDIFAVKISDAVATEEDEPAFLMVAAHHGNEYGTPIVALDAISRLTTGYGTDPVITDLVDRYEIWIAPVWNPDGYWTSRHNRNPNGTVDLNRNYPFLWDSACNTGVKGVSAGSEPETQTMMAFSEDQRFAKVLDYHSSGRETLHGYRCNVHQLAAYLQSEATALSQASGYGGRQRGPSSNGEHYQWQLGNYSNYAFLTEISNTQSPTRASADQEAATVWPGTVWMLQRSIPVWGHVLDAATRQPIEANISYVENPFTEGERNRSEPRFGRFHAFLPPGMHTLRIAAPGYVTQDVPVTVVANAEQQVTVRLVSFNGLRFSTPNGVPTVLAPAGGTTLRVEVQAGGSVTPRPGTGRLLVRAANGASAFAMTEVTPNVYEAVIPGGVCADQPEFWVTAEDTTGRVWEFPSGAPSSAWRGVYGSNSQPQSQTTFEVPSGWTGGVAGDTAIRGNWNRMDPEATAAQPEDDHTAAGVNCWVTNGFAGNSLGANDVDGGFTTLLSPRLDLTGLPGVSIAYWRWFSNNRGSAVDDVLRVDISNDDGVNWTSVEVVGPTGVEAQGGWYRHEFPVARFVTPTAMVRIRVIAEDTGSGSIVEAAFDDFSIRIPSCDGFIESFGTACADSSGRNLRLDYRGSFRVDGECAFVLEAGVNLPAMLSVGVDSNTWNSIQLPFDLGLIGATSCWLNVGPRVNAGGIAPGSPLRFRVPNDPSLAGVISRWQAWMADPALSRPTPLVTSNGLRIQLGAR